MRAYCQQHKSVVIASNATRSHYNVLANNGQRSHVPDCVGLLSPIMCATLKVPGSCGVGNAESATFLPLAGFSIITSSIRYLCIILLFLPPFGMVTPERNHGRTSWV